MEGEEVWAVRRHCEGQMRGSVNCSHVVVGVQKASLRSFRRAARASIIESVYGVSKQIKAEEREERKREDAIHVMSVGEHAHTRKAERRNGGTLERRCGRTCPSLEENVQMQPDQA